MVPDGPGRDLAALAATVARRSLVGRPRCADIPDRQHAFGGCDGSAGGKTVGRRRGGRKDEG